MRTTMYRMIRQNGSIGIDRSGEAHAGGSRCFRRKVSEHQYEVCEGCTRESCSGSERRFRKCEAERAKR